MTRQQAEEIVAQMRRETPCNARVRLIKLALALGKLSKGAAEVYRAELEREETP